MSCLPDTMAVKRPEREGSQPLVDVAHHFCRMSALRLHRLRAHSADRRQKSCL